MEKEKTRDEPFSCPVGRLFSDLEAVVGKDSDFLNHFNKSRVELLKAIRSLLDEKIERIEKRESGRKGKKWKILRPTL